MGQEQIRRRPPGHPGRSEGVSGLARKVPLLPVVQSKPKCYERTLSPGGFFLLSWSLLVSHVPPPTSGHISMPDAWVPSLWFSLSLEITRVSLSTHSGALAPLSLAPTLASPLEHSLTPQASCFTVRICVLQSLPHLEPKPAHLRPLLPLPPASAPEPQ